MRACSRVDQQSFRKILWPQDYLLEWDDRYSVADIVDINLDIASSSTDVILIVPSSMRQRGEYFPGSMAGGDRAGDAIAKMVGGWVGGWQTRGYA